MGEMPLLTKDTFDDLDALSKRCRELERKNLIVSLHFITQSLIDMLRVERAKRGAAE